MHSCDWEVGPIRPPSEAFSLLFRLSRNCPWNRCGFCNLYKGNRFELRPVEDVLLDVDTARRRFGADRGGVASVFLQDADAMLRPTDDLVRILQGIRDAFPNLKRITAYTRSASLCNRKVEDLQRLRAAGLDRVHIGLESGDDVTLANVRKGVTAEKHVIAGRKVREAGMELSEYVMPGLGGAERSAAHAEETARTLNLINPDFIRIRTLSLRPGTPLYEQWIEGEFKLLDEASTVAEIRDFIQCLDRIDSVVISDHMLNLLQEVEGALPGEKAQLMEPLDRFLALPDEERKHFIVGRRLGVYNTLDDMADPLARSNALELKSNLERRIAGTGLTPEAAIRKLMERVI